MTVPGNIDALLLGGQRGYQIERSLRFNSADSAYLTRTPASAGNRKTWTWSGWVKRSALGSGLYTPFSFGDNSTGATDVGSYFRLYNDILYFEEAHGGVNSFSLATSQVFRDTASWYHFVFSIDTTQATASNRIRIYVNGSQITSFSTATYPTQNFDTSANQAGNRQLIGALDVDLSSVSQYFDGYLTEVHFIDGQALTPSSFGETDTITGVWKPKKYAGTYGTNGFYLKFADNSGTTSTTLGKDSSGNGNNWTPNNFSVTAGAGNDSLIDTPTPYADGGNGRGNYCTLNPLAKSNGTLSDGNLVFAASGDNASAWSTFAVNTGKWYWEVTKNSGDMALTLAQDPKFNGYQPEGDATGLMCFMYYSSGSSTTNRFRYNGTNYAFPSGFGDDTDGTIYSFTLNFDTGEFKVKRANDSATEATFSMPAALTAKPLHIGYSVTATWPSANFTYNFGQRAFAYTPPSGFLALNTQNLPEPSIKKPSNYFDTLLYTGNGSASRTLSGLGFSPDLTWIKDRTNANWHRVSDTVRGGNKQLYTNVTDAETANDINGYLSAFTSDGFTVAAGSTSADGVNKNGNAYVAWCWDESATPGFDIVTYTGNGATDRTVAHSLGVAPAFFIIKNRTTATDWPVYHKSLPSHDGGNYPTNSLRLNTTGALANTLGLWAAPTSTVITVSDAQLSAGNRPLVNTNGDNYVAYLWSEVAGFSKFGSYTGNGSTDGPFVFCGFRPRWVMVKCTNEGALNWLIFDALRPGFNVVSQVLLANDSASEVSGITAVDFTSNGFKLRDDNINRNKSGNTYIFAAFAESPQKYSLAR